MIVIAWNDGTGRRLVYRKKRWRSFPRNRLFVDIASDVYAIDNKRKHSQDVDADLVAAEKIRDILDADEVRHDRPPIESKPGRLY